MSNPFDSPLLPAGYDLTLLDRKNELQRLKGNCTQTPILNYRYISPRGTGKTELLNGFFTREKCRELAKAKKLVQICHFSGAQMQSDEKVYVRLIKAVKDSLRNLGTGTEEYKTLLETLRYWEQEYPDYIHESAVGKEVLDNMLYDLKDNGYRVTLVLDEFHQLACAEQLAEETFSNMAELAQDQLISYIVFSDYDDKVGSKSYHVSNLARTFASGTIHLKGIVSEQAKAAVMELIRSKLVDTDVTFTDEELLALLEYTSGIPGLLHDALKDIFQIKSGNNRVLTVEELQRFALSACDSLLGTWVQYFDDDRWENVAAVLEFGTVEGTKANLDQDEDKRHEIAEAGLIYKDAGTQTYRVICPILEDYLRAELARRKPAGATANVSVLKEQIKENYARFKKLKSDVKEKEKFLFSNRPGAAKEAEFRNKINQMNDEKFAIDNQIEADIGLLKALLPAEEFRAFAKREIPSQEDRNEFGIRF